jgi:ATP-dependent RNA helicase DDX1
LLPDFGSLLRVSSDLALPSSAKHFETSAKRRPLAIILEPARDLAEQVYNSILDMSKYVENPQLKTILLVGNDDTKQQRRSLSQGADIVVGTIGKMIDLVKDKHLGLSDVKFFVLDEADRLIDNQQTLEQIMTLYRSCPVQSELGKDRFQVCFFSATLHSPEIRNLAAQICYEPTWVDLKGAVSVPETVHHVVYRINPDVRDNLSTSVQSITDQVHLDTQDIHEINSNRIKERDTNLIE